MNVELKHYRTIDKSYVWKVYVHALRDYIEEMWGWDQTWQENKFDEGLNNYHTSLVYVDGDRAGYVQTETIKECIDVSNLILEPDYQSKGVGAIILDRLQPKNPNHALRLQCFKVNHRAYKFYLKDGFKVVKTDDKLIYMQRYQNS